MKNSSTLIFEWFTNVITLNRTVPMNITEKMNANDLRANFLFRLIESPSFKLRQNQTNNCWAVFNGFIGKNLSKTFSQLNRSRRRYRKFWYWIYRLTHGNTRQLFWDAIRIFDQVLFRLDCSVPPFRNGPWFWELNWKIEIEESKNKLKVTVNGLMKFLLKLNRIDFKIQRMFPLNLFRIPQIYVFMSYILQWLRHRSLFYASSTSKSNIYVDLWVVLVHPIDLIEFDTSKHHIKRINTIYGLEIIKKNYFETFESRNRKILFSIQLTDVNISRFKA